MINKNYSKLEKNYLFTEVARRCDEFVAANPGKRVIKLGVGDVTRPLAPVTADAIIRAMEELKHAETFRGYGPEVGYAFSREAVARYYATRGITIDADEVTIGDGIGEDIANIVDLFNINETKMLVQNPVYPLYKATSIISGFEIEYLKCSKENNFTPTPPENTENSNKGLVVFLCSPNNPTGAAFTMDQLQKWVEFANRTNAIILYDNAYERYITDNRCPHSIYEIEGARSCAIEFNSLSKTAGFTCVRMGYNVIPKELERDGVQLLTIWKQRQTTKYNGAPYMTQRGLETALSEEGLRESDKNIEYYRRNVKLITDILDSKGIYYTGGVNSPYIWFECPNGMKSWEFFDYLLNKFNVVGTPGVGFGTEGEGYFRLTSFGSYEDTAEAAERLKKL